MDLNFFKKVLKHCVDNQKKIIVLGRGFSTSFFLKNKNKKKNIIIGFNTDEIVKEIDFYFTNKSKIPKNLDKKRLIEFNKIVGLNRKRLKIFKIGYTNYSIDPLLFILLIYYSYLLGLTILNIY